MNLKKAQSITEAFISKLFPPSGNMFITGTCDMN